MNENHIKQIFANYIDRFEEMNGPVHQEYFKWRVAKQFRPMMDDALSSGADDFPGKLSKLQQKTSFLIDSRRIQPFSGLVRIAKQDPEAVRGMFQMLFSGGGSLENVGRFINASHELRDKYFPDSFRYTNDVHSVTAYLAMYDPDHHYIFKASHARRFADCIEFYDDWGSGDTVKLDVYYRMCDQLVEAISGCEELLATADRRFTGELSDVDPDTLYGDPQRHILAFDLIYCCSTYNLFAGINFSKKTAKERQAIRESRAEHQYQELCSWLNGFGSRLDTFIEICEGNSELFEPSRMETLTESLKDTEQAISDLLKVIKKRDSHNMQ